LQFISMYHEDPCESLSTNGLMKFPGNMGFGYVEKSVFF
jgi:hypothetical protein